MSIVEEEKKLAKIAYEIMVRDNTVGYEPANHYYFNKGLIIEKYLNCDYIIANCNWINLQKGKPCDIIYVKPMLVDFFSLRLVCKRITKFDCRLQ